jgi:beta-fructofuranosidase
MLKKTVDNTPFAQINRRQFMARSVSASASIWLSNNASASFLRAEGEALKEHMANDPHRPRYHFLPAANWTNDPNGPIFWKGYYHLFHQYNPNGAYWGDMHWGHARSKDLVHWEHLPIALAPTPGGPDKDGVFSGSAFVKDGVPVLVYTGVSPEVQCLAMPDDHDDDGLIKWKKSGANPVIASPPEGLKVTGFRDPSIWKENDTWLMTVGSGFKGKGGAVLLYESKDIEHWDYVHPLYVGTVAADEMWECPDFFPLGDKHVLLVSTQGSVFYFVGSYRDRKFYPEARGRVDLGKHYYAAKSFDDRGRRILWAWLLEARSDSAQRAAGWAGVMSLPRVLSLDAGGTLRMEAASEIQKLRNKYTSKKDLKIDAGSSAPLSDTYGDSLEINAEFDQAEAEEFGLIVRRSPSGSEETSIGYSRTRKMLLLDTRKSSQNPETKKGVDEGLLELGPHEALKLKIFLDGSVVEIFANGRAVLTGRIYPTRADSLGLAFYAQGGRTRLASLDVYEMSAISKDRLTS